MGRFDKVEVNEKQEWDLDTVSRRIESAYEIVETLCPSGRGKSLAATKLEEALYWATKSICGNDK